MRNVFDQYEQPENRLTHALACTLNGNRELIRPFLHWLGIPKVPPTKELQIVEQQVPGDYEPTKEIEERGLPDLCAFTDSGWCVVFECKAQAGVSTSQLRRHRRTVRRHGFEEPHLVLLTVDEAPRAASRLATTRLWREVYGWFRGKRATAEWPSRLTEYMEIFESRMLSKGYGIRGTITMFDGLKFDEENPYTYREGKRLLRLLRGELVARKGLQRIGADPDGAGRGAITGRGGDSVWDFIPLTIASKSKQFTRYPHLTISLERRFAVAAVTIPNGVRAGFRTRLRASGYESFHSLLVQVEDNLRPIVRRSKNAKPMIYALQRHYPHQRSSGVIDARLEADLRTLQRTRSRVKNQPQWCEAIYQVLTHKKSNIQVGMTLRLSYECPLVRSTQATELFEQAWVAMTPVLDFVVAE